MRRHSVSRRVDPDGAVLSPEPAPAKINLHLHVTGRRPDGYHLLDSLVVFAGAADLLTAEPDERLTLAITGPFADGLRSAADDNLVLRAARALAHASGCSRGAAIRLEKNLPLASGIGGGSADAAAALRLLGRLWDIDDQIPRDLAVSLGADVPVCLASAPARMRGIGDDLQPAPVLPPLDILLVNPLVPVATASVFRARNAGLTAPADFPAAWTTAADAARDLSSCRNDLQVPAIAIAPVIGDILVEIERQQGCLLARMSGSGATCFGLFEPGDAARRAHAAIASPDWWLWHGRVSTRAAAR